MSGILCLSCNDWLDVSPSTEKDKEDILSNQAGFRSALIGAYIRMKSGGLYGKEMTWGWLKIWLNIGISRRILSGNF